MTSFGVISWLSSFVRPSIWPALLLVVLLVLLACGGGGGGAHLPPSPPDDGETVQVDDEIFPRLATGKVGMVLNPRDLEVDEPHLHEAMLRGRRAGVQVYSAGYLGWADLEPVLGTYQWSEFDLAFATMDRHGHRFEVALDAGHILEPGGSLRLPSDLDPSRFRFDDPAIVQRYTGFIAALARRYGHRLRYLMIHGEGAGAYFTRNPDQLAGYQALMASAFAVVRPIAPGVLLSVSSSAEEPEAILRALNRDTDYYSFIFGHREPDLLQPAQAAAAFAKLVALSGAKRFAIQDQSWPTATSTGSSRDAQAAFIREMFRLLKIHRGRIEYMSYYALHDDPRAKIAAWADATFPDQTPGWRSDLVDWITSVGLLDEIGAPKPGWSAWMAEVLKYYRDTAPG
jgi:hypothetical protein